MKNNNKSLFISSLLKKEIVINKFIFIGYFFKNMRRTDLK
jgi:hypothetical protein